MGGEYSSSYCPFFTLQIKPNRKSAATAMLAIRRSMITAICKILVKVAGEVAGDYDHPQRFL
jgi:hypothetical protein